MEDVLDIYERPYDEKQPVVCLDESTHQLIGETKIPIPASPGKPKQYDYEYVRNGVAHMFMMFEPLGGKRYVKTGESHKGVDFAHCLKELADKYPDAEKIILVMDNLVTHTLASLYVAYEAEEARELAKRFEVHKTPKHGSWLDMAEIEIGILNRQCLNRRIPSMEMIKSEIAAWENERNAQEQKAHWQFTTRDARIKLQHLYPRI
jgi:hypothetical protein